MHLNRIVSFFDIFGKAQKAYSKQLEPVCRKWNLTRSEVDVLLFLYNNPQFDRAADVVTHRGMTKSHVSMSIANLADRKLLERSYSPEDRRTIHLRLLEEGVRIATEAREAQLEFFAMLYRNISMEELSLWDETTQKVYKNIENMSKM